MNKINLFLMGSFLAIGSLITFNSCEKEGGCDENNISATGGNKSHNMGQNCMHCHVSGGEGEGCFTAAGTAYDSLQTSTLHGGKIEFFTGPDGTGTISHTINIDNKGNFYTTASFSVSGLYPVLTSPLGQKKYMGSALSSGQCNSCHGVSTDKIWGN
jgi:hypothetical protein